MTLKKLFQFLLAGLIGFIIGVGLTTMMVLKEQYFWGFPELRQANYIQDLKETTDALQILDLRLRLALTQMSRDLERIFGDGVLEAPGPRGKALFSEQSSQRPGAPGQKNQKQEEK